MVLIPIVVNLQPDEIGGHYLAQMQHGGCPLSAFKFPPRVHFPPQSIIKVWAMSADPGCCKPPADYVFKQLLRWCVGADISHHTVPSQWSGMNHQCNSTGDSYKPYPTMLLCHWHYYINWRNHGKQDCKRRYLFFWIQSSKKLSLFRVSHQT